MIVTQTQSARGHFDGRSGDDRCMPSSNRRFDRMTGLRVGTAGESAGKDLAAGARGSSLLLLESCNSTWLFDTARKQFRRVLKGLDLDARHASTNWRDYERLDLDAPADGFVVVLNDKGTRCIRSWRHTDGCLHCGSDVTMELSSDEISMLVDA
jgi:hypothetical protein